MGKKGGGSGEKINEYKRLRKKEGRVLMKQWPIRHIGTIQ